MSNSPSMTKHHFIAIAKVLNDTRPGNFERSTDRMLTWIDIVNELTALCRSSNERFDEAKFLEACGYNEACNLAGIV